MIGVRIPKLAVPWSSGSLPSLPYFSGSLLSVFDWRQHSEPQRLGGTAFEGEPASEVHRRLPFSSSARWGHGCHETSAGQSDVRGIR